MSAHNIYLYGNLKKIIIYHKNPKNWDTKNIVVIILKFEQRGYTIEKGVQKI